MRIYPESVLKAVWRRIRKPSRKTILKLLSVPVLAKLPQAATRLRWNTSDTNTTKERATGFAVLRAAQLTLSRGYRYLGIINEAAGYAITDANAYAIGNMAFGNSYTTYVPGPSIPIFKREPGLMIHCFNERPAGGFALDAQFISHSIRTNYDLPPRNYVKITFNSTEAMRSTPK